MMAIRELFRYCYFLSSNYLNTALIMIKVIHMTFVCLFIILKIRLDQESFPYKSGLETMTLI